MPSNATSRTFFLLIIAFIAGSFSGSIYTNKLSAEHRGKIIREGQVKHINPILACEVADAESFSELIPVKNHVQAIIDSEIAKGNADNISFYLRALNSGRWFGINEEIKYSPASMFKTIIMLAYLKQTEANPQLLEENIKYNISPTEQKVPLPFRLEAEKTYSVWEIIENMIINSSNVSLGVLLEHIDSKFLDDVFRDMNIDAQGIDKEENIDHMSPRTYSLVYRVLYGSSYLNREMSEKGLELLTRTQFLNGLREGVPNNIEVAHKYGSRVNNGNEELHDCGIVYYPSHPYLICVMTRGKVTKNLNSSIANISKVTYQEMDAFYRQD